MRRFSITLLSITLALIAILSLSAQAQSLSAPRVTQPIDENKLVTLPRHTLPMANRKHDMGTVADSFYADHILMVLQRSPEQEQELDNLIEQLNDRNSPNFHRWLTPEQFGEYGVAPEDLQKVTDWLESHGFQVDRAYPNRMFIAFSGTAGQIRDAFHTSIHQLYVNGKVHMANMSDPQVPEALAPVIKGIFSLNDLKPEPMYRSARDYTFAGCASSSSVPTEPGSCYAITPVDNQVIYNLNTLYSLGYSGQGQTIALTEDTDTYGTAGSNGASDWNTYRSTFGLTANFPLGSYSIVHPGGCTDPGTNGDDGEAAIDVEVASAIAPSAAIQLISCPSGSFTFGGIIAIENLLNESPFTGPYVISQSYGLPEALTGAGGTATFYNTFQQAAAEGVSVFVSTGDSGSSEAGGDFGTDYEPTSLSITGWGETPYNVAVGGTDFEDVYNAKTGQNGGAALSTYWNSTNGTYYGSAKSYVPEMPWNDSCGDVLISELAHSSFVPYGSTGTCNTSPFNTSTSYLSTGAGSGGPSNCATGAGGTNQYSYLITGGTCQGYSKPSYQSGTTLSGGNAVYGMPSDMVRDIPDVSMFAANGIWGHFETVCWSDPSQTSGGATSCSGAPSTWAGFGGTSVASPTMAAIQALVNQKTGETWGNPNPIYYQMAQNEYGNAGGSFLGSACNSSTGSGPTCVFNDVTQGDIDMDCEHNGATLLDNCYLPSGTYGVNSTDNVTAAAVINGGTGYTSAPTCTIAGPSNSSPYKSPTGTTLWAGGTQAACTAAVNSGSTTNVWSVVIEGAAASLEAGPSVVVGGTTYTFVASLSGASNIANNVLAGSSTTNSAKNLEAAINANSAQCGSAAPCYGTGTTANASATATESTKTVTLTAKSAGYAGRFNVTWGGNAQEEDPEIIAISQTTAGQGPNYVSGITITTAGSGYGPNTPMTLTGGGGSGAIAVANTSIATTAQSYQPAWGAGSGYDLATGLGTPNAVALVCNGQWAGQAGGTCPQTITVTTQAPASAVYNSTFNVVATASSGLAVAITTDGVVCSGSGSGSATITMLSGTGTCHVYFNQAGNGIYAAATQVTETTTATTASSSTTAGSSLNPSTYGQSVSFTANVTSGAGSPTGSVQFNIDGSPFGSPVTLSAGSATSGNISTLVAGTHTVTAVYSGDSDFATSTGTLAGGQVVSAATAGTAVTSNQSPSVYGQSVTFTATINGEYGLIRKAGRGIHSNDVSGTVTWSANTGCGTTAVTSGNPGTATCTTSTLAVGTDTITGTYNGDGNHSGSSGTLAGGQTVTAATPTAAITPSPVSTPYTFTTPVSVVATFAGTGVSGDTAPGGVVTFTANTGTIHGSFAFTQGSNCVAGGANNTSLICTGTYTPSGTLAVGTYANAFSASIAAAGNYGASATASDSLAVITEATTTTLTATPNPSTGGQSVAFTATVNPAPPKTLSNVGSITWTANGVTIGTTSFPYNNTGSLTLNYAGLLPGGSPYNVIATYSGGVDLSASTSNTVVQVVNVEPTSTSLSAPSTSTYGQSQTLSATVSTTNGATPTGVVTFKSGSTVLGNGTLAAAGSGSATASLTTTALPVGTDSVTANYAGSALVQASASTASTVTVSQATSTTTVTSSPNPSLYGQSVAFTATVAPQYAGVPTGTVTFFSGLGTQIGTITLSGGKATLNYSSLNVGTGTTITAVYNASTDFAGSNGNVVQVVNQVGTTTALVSNTAPPVVYGQPVMFTATVTQSSGMSTPTGSVQFKNGSTLLGAASLSGGVATFTTSALPFGSDAVTAYYLGTGLFSASNSTSVAVSVGQATSSTALAASPVSPPGSTGDQMVTFTASVTPQYSGVATGTVTFTNGGTSIGTATLNGSGVAVLKYSALLPGTHSIVATYNGSSNVAGSASAASSYVVTIDSTSTVLTPNPNPSTHGNSVALTATVTPANGVTATGAVSFYSGATLLGNVNLSGGVATLNHVFSTAGSFTLKAVYAGSSYQATSTSATVTQVVQ